MHRYELPIGNNSFDKKTHLNPLIWMLGKQILQNAILNAK